MDKNPGKIDISIVIVNYNSSTYLLNTVKSVKSSGIKSSYEIIIVDNNSTDNSLKLVMERFPDIKILETGKNLGFAKGNNIGVRSCRGQYILLLNSDTILFENTTDILFNIIKNSENIGVISPVLLNEDRSFQLSFGRDLKLFEEFFLKFFSGKFYKFYYKLKKGYIENDVDWVSGACFMVPKYLYEQISGFDESFFIYLEDADLCKRIREKGYKVHITSRTSLIHLLGKSTKNEFNSILPEIKKSHLHYYSKHNGKIRTLILKLYLFTKFTLKKTICIFIGDKKKERVLSNILSSIKNFK